MCLAIFDDVADASEPFAARIVKLAEKLNPSATVKRTAELCKADLATNLVFEFTELQGFIGENYALLDNEKQNVAKTICEHYFPLV